MNPTPEMLAAIKALLAQHQDTQAMFVLTGQGWLTSEALAYLRQHAAEARP